MARPRGSWQQMWALSVRRSPKQRAGARGVRNRGRAVDHGNGGADRDVYRLNLPGL